MKKYIYMAVAAIAALSSCSSDNDPIMGETGKQALVFTATMEGSEGTRATYNSGNKCASWETVDQISINGVKYNAQSAGLTTTFRAATEGEEAGVSPYKAYFPADLYNGVTATLPAVVTETWDAGKFNMPMYATSTTTDLAFKNLCGVLKITVKSDQIAAVKKIRVSSANCAVSGAFSVNSNNAAVLESPDATGNTLTVTYTAAVTTTPEGRVFYVAVPAQTYQRLKIELDADGLGFTKSMTTKSATSITVARNKIYSITFADNAPATTGTAKATIGESEVDVNWVQLWEGGPKFAEYNVGAATNQPEDYGGYYCWGKTTDKDPYGAYKDGSSALSGDDDTATSLWGSKWRMPTPAELQGLIGNCDVAWTENYNESGIKGRIFTGKGDYSSNSIFLPAAGYGDYGDVDDQGDIGYYWSSTPFGSYAAYYLYFDSVYQLMLDDSRCYGYSVRAVLVEAESPVPVPATTGTADRTGGTAGWVQLWDGGPKFAEYNVGASSATDLGAGMTFIDAAKTGADYVWGANWRTPSKSEMEELLNAIGTKVYCEYTNVGSQMGFKFTGKETGYTGNSVFFPAQNGRSEDGSALYWSGTSAPGNKGYRLELRYFNDLTGLMFFYAQSNEYLVRPVLNN